MGKHLKTSVLLGEVWGLGARNPGLGGKLGATYPAWPEVGRRLGIG